MNLVLPPSCEQALFEQFLRAESMALLSVRSAQTKKVPRNVRIFLARHEADEERHLQLFEGLLAVPSFRKATLPAVPSQWPALAVHLYGYESLGLEFARLLVTVRPEFSDLLKDEEVHVGFFEQEVRKVLASFTEQASEARAYAGSWSKRLPKTIENYLRDAVWDSCRLSVRNNLLSSIHQRFSIVGLLKEVELEASPAIPSTQS